MKKVLLENIIKRIKNKILSEGALDKPILDLSRIITSSFVRKKGKRLVYTVYRSGEEIDLNIIIVIKSIENHNEPFEVSAYAQFDKLKFTITYDPSAFPLAMNDLVAEIKETVTHELEHIVQQNFEDDYINPLKNDFEDKQKSKNYNYFVKNNEVPAFVKGLIKRARTKKITLDQAMEEWYSENHRNFDNKEEWESVKNIWMNYANENLAKQKVKKFR